MLALPRLRFLLVTLALAGLAVSACGGSSSHSAAVGTESLRPDAGAPIVVGPGQPIVVGISVPLTGPEAAGGVEDRDAAITGIARWKNANGARIAGHQIEVHAEDDGCTESAITVQAAERLLATPGLVGVLGPDCSAGALAALNIYQEGGIVTISGSATRTALSTGRAGRFFFRTAYRNELLGSVAGQYAAETMKLKTMWVVDDAEVYGSDLAGAMRSALKSHGVTVTGATAIRGTADFGDLAKQITEAAPEMVAYAGFNPDAALFYRQLRDAGYQGLYGSGDAAATTTFVEAVGAQAAEGVYFAGCSLSLPDDFRADFTKVHGSGPGGSAFVAQYADAATILLDAVAKVAVAQDDGSLSIDPGALRDAVRATDLENGLSGRVAFDIYGERVTTSTELTQRAVETGIAACQVRDGQLVNFFP